MSFAWWLEDKKNRDEFARRYGIDRPQDPDTFIRGLLIGMLIGVGLMVMLAGCAHPIYPTTTGGHAAAGVPEKAYVVWSNHPGAAQYVTGILLQAGRPVVERARLQSVFDEQRVILSHATESDILKVGHLVGASHVIFVDVHGLELTGPWESPKPLRVGVRSVAIETGAVQWIGLAYYDEPTSNPESSVIALTYWALARGNCDGRWEEPRSTRQGGCQTTVSAPVTKRPARTEPEIWTELRRMENRR